MLFAYAQGPHPVAPLVLIQHVATNICFRDVPSASLIACIPVNDMVWWCTLGCTFASCQGNKFLSAA